MKRSVFGALAASLILASSVAFAGSTATSPTRPDPAPAPRVERQDNDDNGKHGLWGLLGLLGLAGLLRNKRDTSTRVYDRTTAGTGYDGRTGA